MKEKLINYIYGIADNNLILGQRLAELCGHGPELETDIAITNISLDLLGQVRNYYQYAASLSEAGTTEDDIAFLRKEQEYRSVLLCEQPNTDFAYVIVRQFFFDTYHLLLLENLQNSNDDSLTAIAKKSIKEVKYHRRFSSDWLKRLGDGTAESKQRAQAAVNDLWPYTDEFFQLTEEEKEVVSLGIGVNTTELKEDFYQQLKVVLDESTLRTPEIQYFQSGGKVGRHSEHMGYILADLQYMQRAYPNSKW